jgi:hypothetical protein
MFSTSGVDGKLDLDVDADEPKIITNNKFSSGKFHKPRGPRMVMGIFIAG